MSASGLLLCNLTRTPISPVANPCCNPVELSRAVWAWGVRAIVGSAATWPLAAYAQQPDRVRRIGVLMSMTADDALGQAYSTAFAQGLQQLGWARKQLASRCHLHCSPAPTR